METPDMPVVACTETEIKILAALKTRSAFQREHRGVLSRYEQINDRLKALIAQYEAEKHHDHR